MFSRVMFFKIQVLHSPAFSEVQLFGAKVQSPEFLGSRLRVQVPVLEVV